MHIATNASGNFRVCCNSTPGKNQILDSDGNSMHLAKHNIEDVWHSEFYQSLRQQFIDGERPTMCQRCFSEEDAGVKSSRQSYNESWFNESIEILSID